MENNNEDVTKVSFIDESGIKKEGEILTIVDVEGYDNKYAICSVPNNEGNFDIFAYILNQDATNTPVLSDITDPQEKEDVNSIVKQMMM